MEKDAAIPYQIGVDRALDPLNLQESLDKRFKEEKHKGDEAHALYVDLPTFSDAWTVRGLYEKQQDDGYQLEAVMAVMSPTKGRKTHDAVHQTFSGTTAHQLSEALEKWAYAIIQKYK